MKKRTRQRFFLLAFVVPVTSLFVLLRYSISFLTNPPLLTRDISPMSFQGFGASRVTPNLPNTSKSFCWLDTPSDSTVNPSIYQHNSGLAASLHNRSLALKTMCSDRNRRLTKRKFQFNSRRSPTCTLSDDDVSNIPSFPVVKHDEPGITIALLYYGNPGLLLTHLEVISHYPSSVKEQTSLLIIDDGSPPYLRVSDYISKNMALLLKLHRFRLIYIEEDLKFNMGGGKNLAMSLSATKKTILLDLDTVLPTETMEHMLRSRAGSHTAFRFNRRFSNGKTKVHPAVTMLHTDEYWRAGGCDEDFTGSYGWDDVHFWHRWRKNPLRRLNERRLKHIFIQQIEDSKKCPDDSWSTVFGMILVPQKLCEQAASSLPKLVKDPSSNYQLLELKKKTQCWSNIVIRFPWREVWDVLV